VGLIIFEDGGVQKRASEEGLSGIHVPSSNMAVRVPNSPTGRVLEGGPDWPILVDVDD